MRQIFQLVSHSCLNLTSFAVVQENLNIKLLVWPEVKAMRSKRPFSNSSQSLSPIAENKNKNDKKLKKLRTSSDSKKLIIEESDTNCFSLEIERLKNDPTKIEKMTVEELRKTLRSVKVPAKGRKDDLVSALKCFMDNKMRGQDFQVTKEEGLFVSSENASAQGKDNTVSDGDMIDDVNTASEISELPKPKRRSKQSGAVGKNVKMIIKKLAVKSDGVSDGKLSRAKRKVSSDVIGDAEQLDGFNIQTEPWTVLAHKKPQKGWIAYSPRTMRPPPLAGDTKPVKLLSWNVNGLRALLKLEGFSAVQLARREDFDVLCLQETKLQEKDVEEIKQCLIDGYDNSFWTCSVSKLGYSGTSIISRIKPLSVRYGLGIADHDSEGRIVTAEFDSFYLISAYVPNSGDGLRRLSYRISQWDPSLSNYMKELEKTKPVILTGDLNCAHEEIDIYNPAGNRRSAGFTDEERQSFATNFLSKGFVDTFRRQHPGVVGYTYWGYRHGGRKTNKGWRLDYFLVSESIADKVQDSYILPDVMGSDHCPIGLILKQN
ncbi:hypothetical protein L6164_034168 [Bauhinia variegata]|uniref:Uncharacterized protein n=1 Tax=Bauhinia variegata TaxID=167791 RepID=A0ACB9KU12_BAUVA|nr:hypothetical protein L6164_034168 [Bauhinia variegata]